MGESTTAAAAACCGLLALAAAASAQNHPNLLLIVADDLGVDRVGCYGASTAPPTPNIDALAAGGLRFTRAYVNPACSPTRGAILTGRYSFRTGVPGTLPFAAPGIDPGEIMLPVPLAAVGYSTALIGKWHLGTRYGVWTPNLFGWQHFAGNLEAALLDYYQWPKIVDGVLATRARYATSDQVDDALAWINGQSGQWVLMLSFFAPHSPFQAPPPDLHTQNLAGLDPLLDPVPFHRAMIEAMDHEIGRLLGGIAAATRANTNIIFLGDNGTDIPVVLPPQQPDHVKGSMFEGGGHVPLIVRGPAVHSPGTMSDAFISGVDLFPTILELCGSPYPLGFDQTRPIDGQSFLPVLAGLQSTLRDHVYIEIAGTPLGEGYSVRDGRYRLIRYLRTQPQHEEMYDLATDPLETSNLLAAPLAPATQATYLQLAALLADIRQDGWVAQYGSGCGGLVGVPVLRAQTMPTMGTNFFVHAENLAPNVTWMTCLLGGSRTANGAVTLPLDCTPFGMPGCALNVSNDGVIQLSMSNGYGVMWLPVISSMYGASFYLQAFVAEPGCNRAGLIASRGLRCVVGR